MLPAGTPRIKTTRHMPIEIVIKSVVAGLLASLACGLGVLPLRLRSVNLTAHRGLGYGFAGGLMLAASVYNLILPGLKLPANDIGIIGIGQVLPMISGILLGAGFLATADRLMPSDHALGSDWDKWGGRTGVLIFLAMSVHSIPEGVAVGVGYASGELYESNLGPYIALAIGIHNIPEGLAVAIPMRASGMSLSKCFVAAFLTSLPQPIAAVPASILAWLFKPLMSIMMGFAAGAMIFLILLELLPDALSQTKPCAIAWSMTIGFCLMLLIQVIL